MAAESKEEAIRQLSNTRHKATMLMTRLLLVKEKAKADEVDDRVDVLDARIRVLRQQMMNTWKARAAEKNNQIGELNKKIQKSITAVKDEKKRAEEIVKAIGLIDDVISIAMKFI